MKKHYIWIGLITISLLGILTFYIAPHVASRWQQLKTDNDVIITTITPEPVVEISPTASPSPIPSPTPTPIPISVGRANLNVPFTPQAPFANWDATHEEACEEASILMAQWFAQGKQGAKQGSYSNLIPPDTADQQILDLVQWQKDVFGYFEDTTVKETLRVLQEKLGVTSSRITTEITSQAFKQQLDQGNIIVIPAAGQLLHNPYFKQPGPPYHMLVIRGYNEKGFITNDPGTRRGEGLVYSEDVLLNAIHDWTGSDGTIQSGAKSGIVIAPQR